MALSYRGTSLRHLRIADDPSRVQPPDAENRMSGGVEGLRGEIPVSPSDLYPTNANNNIGFRVVLALQLRS